MAKYKKEEIIKAKVIGLQNYGAFVEVDDEYQGLIHISEISYGYVKNINDYVKIGDKIYTEVIKVDENNQVSFLGSGINGNPPIISDEYDGIF